MMKDRSNVVDKQSPAGDGKKEPSASELLHQGVIGTERGYVSRRREICGIAQNAPDYGLALSGGGIRSATFSLGILQALSRLRLVPRIDYLSTVSGGSYIGSFFGALYVEPSVRGVVDPNLSDVAARKDFIQRPLQSKRGRKSVSRLREFGRYLTPGGTSDTMYGTSLIARNWVSLQLVLGILPLLFFVALRCVRIMLASWLKGTEVFDTFGPLLALPVSWTLAALTLVCALLSVSLSVGFWFSRREEVSPNVAKRLLTNAPLLIAVACAAYLAVSEYREVRNSLANCIDGVRPIPQSVCPGLESVVGAAFFPSIIAIVLAVAALAYVANLVRSAAEIGAAGSPAAPEEVEERVRSRFTRGLATSNLFLGVLLALMLVDVIGYEVANAALNSRTNAGHVATRVVHSEVYAAIQVGIRYFWPFVAVIAPAALTVWAHSALRHGSGVGWLARPAGQASLGLSIMFLWLVIWSAVSWAVSLSVSTTGLVIILGLLTVALLVQSFCYGFLNLSSLVTLYASRLKRAYVGASNPDAGTQGFDIERVGDTVGMPDYYGPSPGTIKQPQLTMLNHARPVHLINVTIAQTEPEGNSRVVAHDRKGKPMQVSPAGIVVPAQGGVEHPPLKFEAAEQLPLSLWTAISGAAASTAIGGLTSLGLSILAMMANVRLGYWWRIDAAKSILFTSPGNTVLGYLFSEFQGRFDSDQNKGRWYLTDGGHFENTGAYALIQRKLDFIIVCDNGADPDYRFDDVVRLIDRARTDLHCEVQFLGSQDLDRLCGASTPMRAAFGTYRELASVPQVGSTGAMPYAALARLRYDIDTIDHPPYVDGAIAPDAPGPLLMLIKPRLNFTEPPELLAYQRSEAGGKFPQQTTLDQFFDEEQWEAYRRFGEVVGLRLFEDVKTAWSPFAQMTAHPVPSQQSQVPA